MIHHEDELRLQAYLDGEITGAEARRVESLLAADQEAQALYDHLHRTATFLADHEPEYRVPETREFYWAKIARQIERSHGAVPATPTLRWSWWFRLLSPLAGAASVVLLSVWLAGPTAPASDEAFLHDLESRLTEARVMSFYSASAGMSVVWVDTSGE